MRCLTPIIALILLTAHAADVPAQVAPAASQPESPIEAAPASPALKPRNPANRSETGKRPEGLSSAATVAGSLALVLGVFFLVVWALRRASPNASAALPTEVFEVLGRAPLANRQQAHLLRCGNKLLLLSVGATDTKTLTEITDPAEVDRLADLCRQARSGGPAAAFRQVFRQKEERDA
jgi:flagellar biogenesis protein FliO